MKLFSGLVLLSLVLIFSLGGILYTLGIFTSDQILDYCVKGFIIWLICSFVGGLIFFVLNRKS